MANVKIPNEDEATRWIKEGKTYGWIIEEIERKYGVRIGHATLSDLRRRKGIPRRSIRSDDLIPWAVLPEHRHRFAVQMLRALGRRRAGMSNSPKIESKLNAWLRSLEEQGAVVHYDPDTEQGWWYVPRRPDIDTDVIRVPERPTTERRARED